MDCSAAFMALETGTDGGRGADWSVGKEGNDDGKEESICAGADAIFAIGLLVVSTGGEDTAGKEVSYAW